LHAAACPKTLVEHWDAAIARIERRLRFKRLTAEAAAAAIANGAPAAAESVPVWNLDTGELRFDGRVIKRIRNNGQATSIVAILAAFQECGWPGRIDDPLPGTTESRRRERLGDAVKSLTDSLVGMQFSRDGTSEGIRLATRTLPRRSLRPPGSRNVYFSSYRHLPATAEVSE
jgi:hypothetical protein